MYDPQQFLTLFKYKATKNDSEVYDDGLFAASTSMSYLIKYDDNDDERQLSRMTATDLHTEYAVQPLLMTKFEFSDRLVVSRFRSHHVGRISSWEDKQKKCDNKN